MTEVLERLRGAGLTVKSSKVSLCQKKLLFVDHQISAKGIEPDPTKLSVIRSWPRPDNIKDCEPFLVCAITTVVLSLIFNSVLAF